jgi:filamentous hemagglutinin family protein
MFNHATMNRAYRLVWCRIRTTWIAVPEYARAMGKSASIVAAGAVLVTGMAGHAMAESPGQYALPTGGQVVSGQVAIAVDAARMDVNQATRNAIVNWNSFNIGSRAQVNFNQPDASSVVLNRVLGGNGSTILGQMTANGNVFLVDPAGIIFAPGARVDVGGLVASSLGISDANFLSGKYQFEKVGAAGTVTNQGAISVASGGYVALIAPKVANDGAIIADRGSVGLAAGDSVNLDFDHDGLLSFQVNIPAAAALIDNKGTIIADGGRVVMNVQAKDALLSTVLNNDGVVRARSVEARNGEIWLGGGQSGVVRVGGTLDASGVERKTSGGVVKVLGDKVGLFDHAKIDVSGVGAGGTAMVGGNWQGKGPEQNATATYVGKDATINADAVDTGDGGTVVVWADKITSFLGNVFARGGARGGNGGTVEVSGKQHLTFNGAVDTVAANGKRGTLLLDPTDVDIVTGGTEDLVGTTNDDANSNTYAFNESDGVNPSNIDPATIVTLLDSSDVTIQATNDITVSNAIDASANTASKGLTLTANNAIFLNANITLKQGATSFLTLTSDADTSGAGTITISGDRTVTVLDGAINFSGITHAPTGGGAESLTLNAGTGTLTMGAIYGSGAVADATGLTTATVTNAGTTNFNGAISITGALTQTNAATGATTFTGAVSVGSADLKGTSYAINNSFASGGTTAFTNSGVITKNATGNITSTGAFSTTGDVNLAANITTTDTNLTIGGNLVIAEAATPTLSTGAGTAGNVTVTGTSNGTTGGVAETLTVQAGTGTVTFTGNVGNNANGTELEALTLTNAAATTFSGTLDLANALTQTNAATGATTFTGAVSVGSADLKGTSYAINNSFASGGTTAFTNSGVITKNATGNITSTGAFSTTGDVNLAANITTTDTNLTIGGNLVIAEAATPTLSTGAGTAGNVTVTGTSNGTTGGVAETLTVQAGHGHGDLHRQRGQQRQRDGTGSVDPHQRRGDHLQRHAGPGQRADADERGDGGDHLHGGGERGQRGPEGHQLRHQQQLRLGRHHGLHQQRRDHQERHRQHHLDGGLQHHG